MAIEQGGRIHTLFERALRALSKKSGIAEENPQSAFGPYPKPKEGRSWTQMGDGNWYYDD